MKHKIYRIEMGQSNAYLIKGEKGYILVDAGMKKNIDKVERKMKNLNSKMEDINLIIITHTHYDHVGSLYFLRKKTKAKVLVHQNGKEALENGESDLPKDGKFVIKAFLNLASIFINFKFYPVIPDIVINDKYSLNEFGIDGEIINTPGHSNGSISIIVEDNCICGDTCFNFLPNSIFPLIYDDKDRLKKSWDKIKSYNCEYYYPGHGKRFNKERFLTEYKKIITNRS